MNRRNFLKIFFGALTAVTVAPRLITAPKFETPKTPQKTPQEEREEIIAKALETPEGRRALAEAMCQPIRRSRQYQSIGRKIFTVDKLA